MRILVWNVMHGGGRRVGKIAARIARGRPDVVILSEFRDTPPSRALAARIAEMGLCAQVRTTAPDKPAVNALLLAARWPLRRLGWRGAPAPAERRLLARVCAPAPLTIAAVHVPNRASGIKYPFLDALRDMAGRRRGGDALMAGDYNTGRIGADESVRCFNRTEDDFMASMERAGWVDAYRHVHGQRRAYTWQAPGGGGRFRLDHAFVSPGARRRLLNARIGAIRESPSDHAPLWITLGD